MSVKTIYTCERCKKEQDTPQQFWVVGAVAYTIGSGPHNYIQPPEQHRLQVCRPCLEILGIHRRKKKAPEVQTEPPTIEELIRELVKEEIENYD